MDGFNFIYVTIIAWVPDRRTVLQQWTLRCAMKPVKSKTEDEPIDVVVKAIVAGERHQSSAADAQ